MRQKHANGIRQTVFGIALAAMGAQAFACPASLSLSQGAELASSCSLTSVELASLINANAVNNCETACVQAYQVTGSSDVRVVASNFMQSDVVITAELNIQHATPGDGSVQSFLLPAGASYTVYKGTLTDSTRGRVSTVYGFTPDVAEATHNANFTYELPWSHGDSHYSLNADSSHFEFALPLLSPVVAARSGIVIGIKDNEDQRDFSATNNHTSNALYIRHDDQTVGVYENLAQNGAQVALGQTISQGDTLALSGQTGAALNPKLTFYVLENGTGQAAQKANIMFTTEEGVFSSFQAFTTYTATHEVNTTTPDLSFENGNDPELDPSGTPTVTPIVSPLSITQIQQVYISYYGRPGDPAGVTYWAEKLEENNGNLSAIIDAFGNSNEYQTRFGGLSTSSLVNNLYQQMFGRDAETAGLDWWSNEIASGRTTLSQAAINIAAGAQNDDLTTLNNRTEMAERITTQIDASSISYGNEDIEVLKAYIQTVDHTTSVQSANLSALLVEISSN